MDDTTSQCEPRTSVGCTQVAERTLNILVVEDSYLIAAGLTRQLTELGHNVIGPAASVGEALDLLSQHRVDAAILDIALGHQTTSEPVARQLRQLGRPFIFLTGHSANHAVSAEFGAHPRLLKPLDVDELYSAVCDLMEPFPTGR